jgi:aspartate/tyrosine/aromatic aminotransferase
VGAYRDAEGRPYVLSAVRKAEMKLVTDPSQNKVRARAQLHTWQRGGKHAASAQPCSCLLAYVPGT